MIINWQIIELMRINCNIITIVKTIELLINVNGIKWFIKSVHTHYGLSWRSIPVSGDIKETEDDVDWFMAEGTPLLLFFGLVSRFRFSWSLQARLSDAQVGWCWFGVWWWYAVSMASMGCMASRMLMQDGMTSLVSLLWCPTPKTEINLKNPNFE